MTKTIFFYWTEEIQEFDSWYYVGNGEYDPIFKSIKQNRRLRYSTENTPNRRKQAREYLKTFQIDHPDAKIRILKDN